MGAQAEGCGIRKGKAVAGGKLLPNRGRGGGCAACAGWKPALPRMAKGQVTDRASVLPRKDGGRGWGWGRPEDGAPTGGCAAYAG